jgi:hypothetical protein
MYAPAATIVRTARRHPRATLSIAAFATRRRRRATRAVRLARQTGDVYARISDPAVQQELLAAASSLAEAFGRAQDLGLTGIRGDRKLAKQAGATLDHLSKALAHARNERRNRHRHLGFVVGLSAVAASAVGAYGFWRFREGSVD